MTFDPHTDHYHARVRAQSAAHSEALTCRGVRFDGGAA